LRDGRFTFEGQLYQYPLNALPEPHSSHGDGWSRPWTLSHLDRRRAAMSLEVDGSAPFPYQCTQSISIDDDRVSIELSTRNLSGRRIPMGFGLHPYFANRQGASVKANFPGRWRWDDEMMPVSKEDNPDAANFAGGIAVSAIPVAAEYADWDGNATIDWPATGLRVELQTRPPLKHAVMWMPAGENFFCLEPVSHASDALNRQSTENIASDFVILEPNATAQQSFEFIVSLSTDQRQNQREELGSGLGLGQAP
jgi:aldose 1-epimerase